MIKLVMAERNINEKAKKSGEFLLIIFTYLFNVRLFFFLVLIYTLFPRPYPPQPRDILASYLYSPPSGYH